MREAAVVADAFRAAPFVDNGWDLALRSLANETGSTRGQLLGLGPRHVRFNWLTDAGADYFADFVAVGGHRPEINWRMAASGHPFELVHEAHYDLVRAGGTDPAYAEHAHRYDAEFGCQMALMDEPQAFFGLAVLRGAAAGRTTVKDRAVFTAAAAPALASIRLQHALEHQAAELLKGSLDAMRTAAVLLDAAGLVCGMTAAAQEALADTAIRVAGQRLRARDSDKDRLLQQRLRAILHDRIPGPPNGLWVDAGKRGYALVDVHPLPRQEWAFGFAPAAVVTLRTPAPLPPLVGQASSTVYVPSFSGSWRRARMRKPSSM